VSEVSVGRKECGWVVGEKVKLLSAQHRTLAVSQQRKINVAAEFADQKKTSRRRRCFH